jgi:hypothetical protein
MALNKTDLANSLYNELNKTDWYDGDDTTDAQFFKNADGTGDYDSDNDTLLGQNPLENFCKVLANKIIDHFESNAEINVTDVQSGSDTASGTIT